MRRVALIVLVGVLIDRDGYAPACAYVEVVRAGVIYVRHAAIATKFRIVAK